MSTAAAAASPAKSRAHVPALDGLRGIAILLVTAYHFIGQAADLVDGSSLSMRLTTRLASLGMYGVDLFFVLSGFLITGILLDTKDAPGYFRNFYARRALRIFPLYYAFLAVVLVIGPALAPGSTLLRAAAHDQAWVWLYGTNLKIALAGQWAFCGTTQPICGQGLELNHLWSLAVEEHFYFVWPVLVYLCSKRALPRVAFALVLTALGVRLLLRHDPMAGYTLTPCRMDALLVGALLSIALNSPTGVAFLRGPARFVVVTALGLFAIAVALPGGAESRSPTFRACVFTLTAILAAAIVVRTLESKPTSWLGRVTGSSLLRTIGAYSYGLYLFHSALRPLFAKLIPVREIARLTHSPTLAVVLYFVLATAGSLALAWPSYHLFEKPFLKLKRYFEAKREVAAEPALGSVVTSA